MQRLQWVTSVVVLIAAAGCSSARYPVASTQQKQPAGPGTVRLLAMGDWGTGKPAQHTTASALRDHISASGQQFDGMLLAGDNFYVRLKSVNDPAWQELFEKLYDPLVLDFPFYVSLGNHDYDDRKDLIELEYARLNPQSRWKLPSRWYRLDIPTQQPVVTILMLDSNRSLMPSSDWESQKRWIEEQLASPTAQWTVAVAHHPLFSNGSHGDNGVLQREWGPIFQRYGLDFYVCGHDHDLQHLELKEWYCSFLLVGGGGAGIRPMRVDKRGPFSKSAYGFCELTIDATSARVRFLSYKGALLHEFVRLPARKVRVIDTTPSDKAVPRTVKSITRGDDKPATTQAK